MSKYIIEIEDEPFVRLSALFGEEGLYRAKGFNSLVFDQFGLDKLTPLDKALSSELGEAYHKGLKEGKKQAKVQAHLDVCHDIDKVAHGNYQKGLDDAWEAARKIALMDTETSENVTGYFGLFRIMENLTPMQAIEKLKAYEEQQEQNRRIMFGDKLLTKKDHLGGVALSNEVNGSVYVWREDCVAYESSPQEWRKTGENIPQVAELLKAMKGGAE